MEKIDRSISDVDAILVTHEHSDHIKGISSACNMGFQSMPMKTWQATAERLGKSLEQQEIFNTGDTVTFET